ncbi:DUF4139 domain-containing protein [Ramlibacter humi]|uniref:Mucoidy inhibitor MuiA family protein n=1 Tax=Ramlibacter humi TaxID=2530451 RepID=A0A4Z0BP74_9BURK|nr:DUF4139 domain-containing protein [Ramlibacter humi]TFZ00068.1 mucoidy inhibitor MuiA family protein [Ramlibacter humi]
MHRIFLYLPLLSAMLVPAFATAQSAPVTAVTLYPGSATVVRSARVEAGATRLVVAELTTQFPVQTLRVEGDPGIRIGQIVTQDASRTESANATQAALEASIQALRDQSAALDAQAGAADIVKGYLERATSDNGKEHARMPMDGKSLASTVTALSQAAADALTRKHQVALQKREIGKKIQALQRDLARVQSQSRDLRTVTIQLTAERAGDVRISYQLNSAGWRPAYRAELDSAHSTVSIDRLAQVSQKTGEDWRGVRLALSTAQPRQSLSAATPQPWLVGYDPPRPSGELAPPNALAKSAAMQSAPMKDRGREAEYEPPTFQADGTFATEFVVSTPVTLPADGREVLLPLARETLAARQRVQVSPRLSTTAMVMAVVDKPAGVWPGGSLQLYRDGSYVGALPWLPDAGAKWALSFGRDELLQVRLSPVKGDSGSTGLFDKRNVRRISDRITLRSSHATPVEVLVLEAAPVSTSDEVKVQTVFSPQPTQDTWEQRRGVVAWVRMLAPQETAAIDVAYELEYPKEGSVTGLP